MHFNSLDFYCYINNRALFSLGPICAIIEGYILVEERLTLCKINWNSLFSWGSFRNLIDILIVWYILYNILVIIKGTRAINLMKGIAVIAAIKFLSFFLGLNTLDWIMNFVIQWGVVAALIVFQPEIRRGLEHIGRSNSSLVNTKVRTKQKS